MKTKDVQIFDIIQPKGLKRHQKILLGGSFNCKKLLYFTCTTEKLHNRHHTTPGPRLLNKIGSIVLILQD